MYHRSLSERIRKHREERSLTPMDMAARLSMDPDRYRQYESGESDMVSLEELKNIAAVFGIPLLEMLFPELNAGGSMAGDAYPLDEPTTLHYLRLIEERNRTIEQLNEVIVRQQAALRKS